MALGGILSARFDLKVVQLFTMMDDDGNEHVDSEELRKFFAKAGNDVQG